VVEQKIDISTAGCIGLNCMNTGQRTCKGKVIMKSNICVTSSVMSPDGSEVTVVFAQRESPHYSVLEHDTNAVTDLR